MVIWQIWNSRSNQWKQPSGEIWRERAEKFFCKFYRFFFEGNSLNPDWDPLKFYNKSNNSRLARSRGSGIVSGVVLAFGLPSSSSSEEETSKRSKSGDMKEGLYNETISFNWYCLDGFRNLLVVTTSYFVLAVNTRPLLKGFLAQAHKHLRMFDVNLEIKYIPIHLCSLLVNNMWPPTLYLALVNINFIE